VFQKLKICLLALLIVCAVAPGTALAVQFCLEVQGSVAEPRVVLRPPQPSDYPVFRDMFNDYLTARYTWFWLGENHWDLARVQEKYESFARDQKEGLREDFAIQKNDTAKTVLGRAAIWKGPTENSWELGITLHRDHWGNRYAEESIREIARHVFEDLGATELRFRTEPENEPMLKQYDRMGIKKVIDAADDIPEPPLFHHYHHFVWSREEWLKAKP